MNLTSQTTIHERENLMRDMLTKGDALRPAYAGFNFDNLDDSQRSWLNRLSVFSKYRKFLTSRWEQREVSTEMKVLFVE